MAKAKIKVTELIGNEILLPEFAGSCYLSKNRSWPFSYSK